MPLTLELPADLAAGLCEEATRLGITLPDYALRILMESRPKSVSPMTGAELVERWQREGVIGSRSDLGDSQEIARSLRSRAERRGA